MMRTEKMESKPNIIIVDDDNRVLTKFKKLLSNKAKYNVNAFVSAEKAFAYLKSNSIDLIFSDFHMPKMNGITFLSKVGKIWPEIRSIILAEASNKEIMMNAVNEIGVFQYLEKPWNDDDLLIVLRNALDNHYLTKTLGEKVSEITKTNSELDGLQNEIIKAFV